jgi:hypothetical protein
MSIPMGKQMDLQMESAVLMSFAVDPMALVNWYRSVLSCRILKGRQHDGECLVVS